MRHARGDYHRIQDPWNKIPENEPVFLLRGQDIAVPETIREYAKIAHKKGADSNLVIRCLEWAREIEEWQRTVNRKVPDM